MAGCSKQEKEEFLAYIGKEPSHAEMLEYIWKCRPKAYWDKDLKKPVCNLADATDKTFIVRDFEELSDPKTFDYYENRYKKNFRKKNETKCSECHGWKLNEEFRFFKTCCRCRASTVEDDLSKQEEMRQSQVCSKCHCRKPYSQFNIKKGKLYKTCVSCCIKSKPKITPEPRPLPPEAYLPETEPPSHLPNLP